MSETSDEIRIMLATRRLKACVEQWPECESGMYDPRCCRFPKSCSPHGRIEAVQAGNLTDDDLEPSRGAWSAETIGVLRITPTAPNDPLERLLDLVIDTIGADDVTIGYSHSDPGVVAGDWYIFAYWRDARSSTQDPDAEGWEIEVENAPTLREALARVVMHPRFGQ